MREQPFLDQILHAAGRKRRAAVLILRGQFLPEPCHGAIEVMQVEPLDPGDPIVFAPAICRAVGAADKQSVEHGEKNRPLQPKAVLARAAELLNHGPAAGLLPQPLEHQRRPDAAAGDLHNAVSAMAESTSALLAKRAPDRNSRSSCPLSCSSSYRPSVAITCWRT